VALSCIIKVGLIGIVECSEIGLCTTMAAYLVEGLTVVLIEVGLLVSDESLKIDPFFQAHLFAGCNVTVS
jgi:hypothetical protein